MINRPGSVITDVITLRIMNEKQFAKLEKMVLAYNDSVFCSDSDHPSFTSRFTVKHSDLFSAVKQYHWFKNCGKPSRAKTTMPMRSVDSFSAGQNLCDQFDWDNIKFDARNQLTMWLHENWNDDYQKWNDFAEANNKAIFPFTDNIIKPKLAKLGLSLDIADYVRGNLQNALIANDYLYTGHTAFFDFELLSVYRHGNIPCGWVGKWPQGYLVVY